MRLGPRVFVSLLALGAALPACASFHVSTPTGFAELDHQDDYDYRSVSADGVVIGIRALRNHPFAGLDFWSGAVHERLRSQGYVPDGEPTAVRSDDGMEGRQFWYVRDLNGRAHRYMVVVFVRPGAFLRHARVFVLEAGGDREVFDHALPAVQSFVRSFGA